MFKTVKTLCAATLLVLSASAFADEGQGDRPHPGKPPREAIDACQGKNDGDACSFTGRRNDNIEGTCHKGPRQEHELACVPKRHGHEAGNGPVNGSEEFREDEAGGNTGDRSGRGR